MVNWHRKLSLDCMSKAKALESFATWCLTCIRQVWMAVQSDRFCSSNGTGIDGLKS